MSFASRLRQILRQQSFRKYLKNTTWLAGGHFLRLSLGLFVSVAMARHLGPGDFGLYNYLLSIMFLIGICCELGLKNLSRRELVRFPEARDAILGTSLILSMIASLTAFTAVLLFAMTGLRDVPSAGIILLFGASLLLVPFYGIETWFHSQTRGDLSVIASTTAFLVFATMKIVAIVLGADLLVFGYMYLGELILVTCIRVFLYSRHYAPMVKWFWDSNRAKSLLTNAWPLLLSGIAVSVYMRIDQVMLGSMLDQESVGQYVAASRLSTVFYFIPQLLAVSLFPAIMRSKEQTREVYLKRIQKYFDLHSGLAYLIIIPGSILSPWLISILYGAPYAGARTIFSIHIWACIFVFMGVARSQFFLSENFLRFSLVCTLSGAALNVLLNFILIPAYSGIGAALATVAAQFLSSFASSFSYRKTLFLGRAQLKSLGICFRWNAIKNLLTV